MIDVDKINELPKEYLDEIIEFCVSNDLKPPNIKSDSGKPLSVMLKYRFYYWDRTTCDKFVKKI